MRGALPIGVLTAIALLCACAGESSRTKPVEVLDERTGMTFAALDQPIELLPDLSNTVLNTAKRSSFAYLGPVEWDKMGAITYGLWVHIAPGNDRQAGDIHAPGAATLSLDDGPLALEAIEAPKLGKQPYREEVSWGQTAYFNLSGATLRRIAASTKIALTVPGADGAPLVFISKDDPRAPLQRYLESRGLTHN